MTVVNNFAPAFRFSSIRNPKPVALPSKAIAVQPETDLIQGLKSINENESANESKLSATNSLLQNFIVSNNFIKTTTDFYNIINVENPTTQQLGLMYDNMIVRLLTKSNTNEVFGLLMRFIKQFAALLNSSTIDKVNIIIPERITFSFAEFEGENNVQSPVNNVPGL